MAHTRLGCPLLPLHLFFQAEPSARMMCAARTCRPSRDSEEQGPGTGKGLAAGRHLQKVPVIGRKHRQGMDGTGVWGWLFERWDSCEVWSFKSHLLTCMQLLFWLQPQVSPSCERGGSGHCLAECWQDKRRYLVPAESAWCTTGSVQPLGA